MIFSDARDVFPHLMPPRFPSWYLPSLLTTRPQLVLDAHSHLQTLPHCQLWVSRITPSWFIADNLPRSLLLAPISPETTQFQNPLCPWSHFHTRSPSSLVPCPSKSSYYFSPLPVTQPSFNLHPVCATAWPTKLLPPANRGFLSPATSFAMQSNKRAVIPGPLHWGAKRKSPSGRRPYIQPFKKHLS